MFKGFRVGAVSLSAVILAVASSAQNPKATLSIQLDKPLHAVSPTLYGLMTEEINYSYDGGLYAEMVRNRTFYDHGWSGIPHWDLVHDGNAEATMTFDGTDGPSEALPRSLLLKVAKADPEEQAGVRNDGYWGMAVRPGTTYVGSFYAKADAGDVGPVRIALISDNTGASLASATSEPMTTGWKKYEFTLKTGNVETSSETHLRLTVGHAEIGRASCRERVFVSV